MKRIVIAGMVMALSAYSLAAQAGIRLFRFNGSICKPDLPASANVGYSQFGIHNLSGTTAATVVCPLPTARVGGVVETMANMAQVTFYDRSTTANVSCTLQAVGSDGFPLWSQSLTFNGGGPGSGLEQFLFQPPSNRSPEDTWMLICTLPAAQNGAVSHITGILLSSQS